MFGAIAKTYFAEKIGVSPEKICCISIMPCIAKKGEAELPGMDVTGTGPDVDIVLPTREMVRLLKAEHILPALLAEETFDSPLGESSGAGVIFGATGGVMEAALRTAVAVIEGANPNPEKFSDVISEIEKEEKKLQSALLSVLQIKAKVTLVPPKTIARSEGKAKRVIDTRKLHD